MTNTDRLAQATNLLRECRKQVATAPHSLAYEYTLLPKIDEFLAALASLAPAAVEGDAMNRSIQAMGKVIEGFIENNEPITQAAELTAAYPEFARKVAALTAQCAFANALVQVVRDYRNTPNRHIADQLLRKAEKAIAAGNGEGV